MTYDTLIKTMEVSAQEKIAELLASAQEHATEITSTANAQGEKIQKNLMDKARKSVSIEKNKELYAIREEVKAALIREKGVLYQAAFDEAGKKLNEVRNSPRYQELFESLLDEALGELEPQELRYHVDKSDEALCARIVSARNLKGLVQADIVTAGGLIVSSADEQVRVFNTIESRLERAQERMKTEIYSVLYGE
jgi:V/A-type H+-transporting ATPase subunit E